MRRGPPSVGLTARRGRDLIDCCSESESMAGVARSSPNRTMPRYGEIAGMSMAQDYQRKTTFEGTLSGRCGHLI